MKGAFPMFCIAQNKEALVTDNMNWHDGDLNWDAMFIKLLKNWEVGSLQLFLDILYSSKVNQGEENRLVWTHARRGVFAVQAYHWILNAGPSMYFPWKRICKVKILSKVAFFSWTAAWGNTLTMGNLRQQNICIVNWCCMCKHSKIDHILLHCESVYDLWSIVLSFWHARGHAKKGGGTARMLVRELWKTLS